MSQYFVLFRVRKSVAVPDLNGGSFSLRGYDHTQSSQLVIHCSGQQNKPSLTRSTTGTQLSLHTRVMFSCVPSTIDKPTETVAPCEVWSLREHVNINSPAVEVVRHHATRFKSTDCDLKRNFVNISVYCVRSQHEELLVNPIEQRTTKEEFLQSLVP